jgi:hypothetical protein
MQAKLGAHAARNISPSVSLQRIAPTVCEGKPSLLAAGEPRANVRVAHLWDSHERNTNDKSVLRKLC